MKKILFAIPLFAMLLVACDPIVDEISPDPNVTPENLTFELVAKNQGNNNIQIVPTPSRYVKVYDATSDTKLAEGTAPSVQVAPPNKELQVYVTTINSDGSITKSASKSIAGVYRSSRYLCRYLWYNSGWWLWHNNLDLEYRSRRRLLG